ncbi:MAG: SDR family oxidoreductase [Actinomycetota bacterium]
MQRIAVVTGASSGIGAEIARALTKRDWRCVLVARREDRLRELAQELGATYEVCDVTDRASLTDVAARHPTVHLLVNNAGQPGRSGFFDDDPDRVEEVMRVNYLGSVWALRAFLPALEASAPSDVVNIVSVSGVVTLPRSGPYAASKHAQLAFSRGAAAQLRARGIRVHTVKPGFVETEGFPQAWLPKPAQRLVIGPERIAQHVLASLEHDRGETTVPRYYRVAELLQTAVPNLFARVLGDKIRR